MVYQEGTALKADQLDWIAKDLATIKDKTAPLFITMHGIFLTYPEAEGVNVSKVYRFDEGGPQLGALLSEFTNVKVFSGHSHKSHFQHTPEGNIREYNYAGANGGWWPAGFKPHMPNLPVCFDGAPRDSSYRPISRYAPTISTMYLSTTRISRRPTSPATVQTKM